MRVPLPPAARLRAAEPSDPVRPRVARRDALALLVGAAGLAAVAGARAQARCPEAMLEGLRWLLPETAAPSVEALRAGLGAGLPAAVARDFDQVFPGEGLELRFTVLAREGCDADYKPVEEQVRIDGHGAPLSHGAILWRFHRAAASRLRRQERRCFAGFHRIHAGDAVALPRYEVRLLA